MKTTLFMVVVALAAVGSASAQVGRLDITPTVDPETGHTVFEWVFLANGLTPQQAAVNIYGWVKWTEVDIVGIVYMNPDVAPYGVFDYAPTFDNFDQAGNAGPLVSDGVGVNWQGTGVQYDLANFTGSITMVFHHKDQFFWLNGGMVGVFFNGKALEYINGEYILSRRPPEVVTQSQHQEVGLGESAWLTVGVGGGGAVDYQWFLKEEFGEQWQEIPGANSDAYNFLPPQGEGIWWFKCLVSNDQGEAESDPVMVRVSAHQQVHDLPAAGLGSLALLCGSVIMVVGGTLRRHN